MRLTRVRSAVVAATVVATGTALLPSGAAGGAPAGPAENTTPAAPIPTTKQVTLVTGDTAQLATLPGGSERASLVAGPGRSEGAHGFVREGDAYLVPAAAQPLVAQDRLDLELFNVSALVEQGYADGAPVIVDYRQPDTLAGGRTPIPTPDGTERQRVLRSIDAVAVDTDTGHEAAFWSDITDRSGPAVDKVWLDARVEGTLDQSAGEIGAPAAWQRGFTGAGVTIATLDSGIDTTHPDFAGRIVDTADFTGGDSAEDHAGHGTHVASIAAGSGAASDGKYRGIAPDADLLVGKVLGDDGTGTMSAAIDGMEWAAGHGADIVNLSLGGPVTRGDDPMSQAIDRLTAEDDTLFVVAAGNYSPWTPGMEFVTSPGSADSALTVGALRRPESLWGNSRRGRMDGEAIKPEITAPGFGITAAGASGAGLPAYVSMTGTSMAAPHVAGAAALLKQQHPQWGAEELRDALTSTAAPIDPYFNAFEQGAGRVDLDRATGQDVFVDAGVLDLGFFARPFHDADLQVTRTLHYRNESADPVDLTLGTDLRATKHDELPAGALTVEPATLHLGPGESREVQVSLDARQLPSDTYSGAVTAGTKGTVVRTTVGFYKQDDTVDVTLRAVDRNGGSGTATVRITPYRDLDPRYYPEYIYLSPQQPEHVVRLPEGEYNVWSLVTTFDESGRFAEQQSIVGDPRLEVHAPNFEVTLDARDAVPVSLDTPRPSQPRSMAMSWWRGQPGTVLYGEDTWYWSSNDGSPERVSVTPTERVDDAPFGLATSFDAGIPPLEAQVQGRTLDAVQVAGAQVDGRHRLGLVDVGTASSDELAGRDLSGRMALVLESDSATPSEQVLAAAQAGAEMVMLRSARPGVYWPESVAGPVPVLTVPKDDGDLLAERGRRHRVDVSLDGTPRTPYAYDVSFLERGRVPDHLAYQVERRDLAEVTTTIYGTGAGEHGWRLHQSEFADCDCGAPAFDDYVPATGYTRTEYVTADPDVSTVSAWQFLFGFPADVIYSRAERSYRPGEKVTEEWLKAPYSPGVPQSAIRAGGRNPVSERDGDRLYYSLAAFTDSAGHWTPTFSPTSAASRLYRDGEQVYANSYGLSGGVTVPPEQATYRIEADVDHDGSQVGLSTETRTAWTFRSAETPSSEPLPLIDVDYVDVRRAGSQRSALDALNAAAPGQRVELVLAASHQIGSSAAPVDEVTVEVSYDDGATWQDASVRRDGETFTAAYRHPDGGTSDDVSLRIHASDGDGGALDQTLVRAYRLRER